MIYWRFMETGLKKTEQTAFAQKLLLEALSREYGITRLPEVARTPLGKPFFPAYPEIQFNYSHSKRAAACILSREAAGIDLEQVRSYQEKTARRFCCEQEWNWLQRQPDLDQAWIRIWTLKEAWLKYLGTGLRTDLQKLDISDALTKEAGCRKARVWADGQAVSAWMASYFMEDFWISVCQEKENSNHVLHLL